MPFRIERVNDDVLMVSTDGISNPNWYLGSKIFVHRSQVMIRYESPSTIRFTDGNNNLFFANIANASQAAQFANIGTFQAGVFTPDWQKISDLLSEYYRPSIGTPAGNLLLVIRKKIKGQNAETLTETVRQAKEVESDCNHITFWNLGDNTAYVEGTLIPKGEKWEIDNDHPITERTKFKIFFDDGSTGIQNPLIIKYAALNQLASVGPPPTP